MLIQYLFSDPILFISFALALVLALSFHEFSHAYLARRLGDRTAEGLGRLTINPLAHLDPLGTLLLFIIGFGWGKPVPFDPSQLRFKRLGPLFVALAGPVSNIFLAILGAIAWAIIAQTPLGTNANVAIFFQLFTLINIALALFNLIPVPPLDGSKLLTAILGPRRRDLAERIEQFGPFLLIGLVIVDRIGFPILSWITTLSTILSRFLLSFGG